MERNCSEKFVVFSSHSVSIHEITHRNRGLPQEQISKEGPKTGFPTLRERAWAVQEEQHSFSQRCFLLPSQTSHEMMMQCVSRVVSHPLHGESCPLAGSPLQTGDRPKILLSQGDDAYHTSLSYEADAGVMLSNELLSSHSSRTLS